MMILRRPTPAQIDRLIVAERDSPFTYTEVGASLGTLPTHGYALDEYGVVLGAGPECFARATAALQRFANYPGAWTRIHPDGGAVPHVGLVFVAHIEHYGFHSLNGCRVVAMVGDEPARRRYGFAFGTLGSHEEQGEECFVVSFDPASGAVRYDVRAFSRPRGVLARLGAPIARALQRRFARDTCDAMRAAAAG